VDVKAQYISTCEEVKKKRPPAKRGLKFFTDTFFTFPVISHEGRIVRDAM